MNWIERLYEIRGRDMYSQNGEGLLLEYIAEQLGRERRQIMFDIGAGDTFILSNSRHARLLGFKVAYWEKSDGTEINLKNCTQHIDQPLIISIDIDGNDYWILDKQISFYRPPIIIAEFNPAFTDSRTIKYNPDHEWAGDDYYGFSFEAGKKLAEKHGYEIIFNVANMNLIIVRKDLIEGLFVPPVTYKHEKFFKESGRPESDWVII